MKNLANLNQARHFVAIRAHHVLVIVLAALPSAAFAIDSDGDGLDDSVETNTGIYVSANVTGTHPLNAKPATNVTGDYRWSTDLQSFLCGGQTNFEGTVVSFTQSLPVSGVVTVHATVTGTPAAKLLIVIRASQNP